jgi:uncharacterized protein (DUF1697 family)
MVGGTNAKSKQRANENKDADSQTEGSDKRQRLDVSTSCKESGNMARSGTSSKVECSNQWILLLRGINVGASGRLPMDSLRSILTSAGCTKVETYIQSGNCVFTSALPKSTIISNVGGGIEKKHGFRPDMFLLTRGDLQEMVDANPFSKQGDANPAKMTLFFHDGSVQDEKSIQSNLSDGEIFHLSSNVLYFYASEGIGKSKLAKKITKFIGTNTARNLNTCRKLLLMCL